MSVTRSLAVAGAATALLLASVLDASAQRLTPPSQVFIASHAPTNRREVPYGNTLRRSSLDLTQQSEDYRNGSVRLDPTGKETTASAFVTCSRSGAVTGH